MTTTAIPGYGGHLANGGATGAAYTNVAQLRRFNFGGLKVEFEDITNLDSPAPGGAVFKEWLKTLVDGGSIQFDGVLNPADPSTQALMTNLSSAPANALNYWKITLSGGSPTTMVFQGYVEEFKVGDEYNKAVPFSGSIKIVGPVTVNW
jgi:hypothetical protein